MLIRPPLGAPDVVARQPRELGGSDRDGRFEGGVQGSKGRFEDGSELGLELLRGAGVDLDDAGHDDAEPEGAE